MLKNGISKDQSKIVQGLAILMMLYHHLFSTPEALGSTYNSLLKIGECNIELKMAWFFKICVGLYAFISGYGLYYSLKSGTKSSNFFYNLFNNYKIVLKKLLSFMFQFWIVFIIFIPIGFIFFDKSFDIKEFILNFIGYSSSYNGAWWYVAQYMRMLLILPIINCAFIFIRNKRYILTQCVFYLVIICSIIIVFINNRTLLNSIIEYFQPAFLLCFIVGYIISRFKLFQFIYKILPSIFVDILGIIGMVLTIVLRVKIAKDASSAGLDFVFVPVFIFGFLILINYLKKIAVIFIFFGKYSTFIWLTHVFFYDHYAKNIVMFSHFSTGIYLTLLLMSTLTAMLLTKLTSIFKINQIC